MSVGTQNIRTITEKLTRWDRRLRLQQTVHWVPRGIIGGLLIALIVALVARFTPLLMQEQLTQLSAGLTLGGALIALAAVWLWPRDDIDKARRFDLLFGLKERTSTALEIASGVLPVESRALVEAQYREAVQVASRVIPGEALPLATDWREFAAIGVLLAALVPALVLPNPQEEILAQQAEVEQAIADEVEELESLRERVQADEALTSEERAEVIEEIDEAINALEQNGVSQEEAVAALENAERELRDLSEQYEAERQQALDEAGAAFEGTPGENFGEALEQGDTQGAGEALDDLDLDSLSEEELQDLAESLGEAADALRETNPEAAQALEDAAEALENGDTAGAQEALDEAAEALENDAPPSEQVESYADEVGEGSDSVAEAGEDGQQAGGEQQQPGDEGEQPGAEGQGEGEGEGQADGGEGEGQGGGFDDSSSGGGVEEYEDVYTPQRVGGEDGEEVDIPGDPDAGSPTGQEGDFADNPEGESNVPYNEVYGDYEDAANEAIENGYVPLSLQDLIRDYFSRLDPGAE